MSEGWNHFYSVLVVIATVMIPIATAYAQFLHPRVKEAIRKWRGGRGGTAEKRLMVTLTDKESGRTFSACVEGAELVVGRLPEESDLALVFEGNGRISRRHCTVRAAADGFHIENHSDNGTAVGVRRLAKGEERQISDLDPVTIADRVFVVRLARG